MTLFGAVIDIIAFPVYLLWYFKLPTSKEFEFEICRYRISKIFQPNLSTDLFDTSAVGKLGKAFIKYRFKSHYHYTWGFPPMESTKEIKHFS